MLPTKVYWGQWYVCLLHVDCRLTGRIIDERGTSNFVDAVKNALGNPNGIPAAMRNRKVDLHPPSLSVTRCTSNLSRDMGLKKLIS